MLEKIKNEESRISLAELMAEAKNQIKIQRLVVKKKMINPLENIWKNFCFLSQESTKIGYKLTMMPYSIIPTEEEISIDWKEVILL
jgi:hypothetical protein